MAVALSESREQGNTATVSLPAKTKGAWGADIKDTGDSHPTV